MGVTVFPAPVVSSAPAPYWYNAMAGATNVAAVSHPAGFYQFTAFPVNGSTVAPSVTIAIFDANNALIASANSAAGDGNSYQSSAYFTSAVPIAGLSFTATADCQILLTVAPKIATDYTEKITSSGSVTLATSSQVLIIGGGGAGGSCYWQNTNDQGAGGGGSGYIATGTIAAGTYSLVVGAGGAGAGDWRWATGGSGGTTTFSTLTAAGGSGGGAGNAAVGGAGGSGGGAGNWGSNFGKGGTNGANGAASVNGYAGGAGSGTAAPFFAPVSVVKTYQRAAGGFYTGGNGSYVDQSNGESAAAGTGGGGGGAGATNNGGNGGSGALYILRKVS